MVESVSMRAAFCFSLQTLLLSISKWDGVKNKQAQKNMKATKLNDLCFFYHSGAKSRRIVGLVEVVRALYENDESGGGCIDVKAVREMRKGIDLQEMKRESGLKDFVMFRQPKLSVVPVGEDLWVKICEMGGGYEEDGGGERVKVRCLMKCRCDGIKWEKIPFWWVPSFRVSVDD